MRRWVRSINSPREWVAPPSCRPTARRDMSWTGRCGRDQAVAVTRMHANEVPLDEELVARLLSAQLPDLAHLPLRRVEPWGTDHGIWRLGDELVIRLPRIGWARRQVAFEARWLPELAPHLPVELPAPVAVGEPAFGYPFQWAVHRWLPGEGASPATIADSHQFAATWPTWCANCSAYPPPVLRGRATGLGRCSTTTRTRARSSLGPPISSTPTLRPRCGRPRWPRRRGRTSTCGRTATSKATASCATAGSAASSTGGRRVPATRRWTCR
jgi:hypothetical protein